MAPHDLEESVPRQGAFELEEWGDLVYTFSRPWSDGTTGIKLSPLELLEKLAALVPLPRVHLVRYAGFLVPHSALREAIIPTSRQQGVGVDEAKTRTPSWNWARPLGRVFALDMATCPFCRLAGGTKRRRVREAGFLPPPALRTGRARFPASRSSLSKAACRPRQPSYHLLAVRYGTAVAALAGQGAPVEPSHQHVPHRR